MSFENWQKENEQLAVESVQPIVGDGFENWQRENIAIEDEETSSYAKQLLGSFVKGGMRLGQAVLQIPQHVAWLAAKAGGWPTELKPGDPLYERLQKITEKPTPGVKLAKFHQDMIDRHKRGTQRIIENHPEWDYDPPENFLDLLTSPRKLSLIIAESTPVFIGAGIMTAGGRPDVGLVMMYASEGQEAYDQAIIDGATENEARTAYHLYGSVASVIEFLQLRGIMKFGKGTFKAVLASTTKKIVGKGLKSITKDAIKLAATEAIEEITQGAWQEATAKIVYDKSIPGGLWGFIDRRAQEGLIGFAMGAIPGVGGVGAAAIRGRLTTGPVQEQITNIEAAKEIIEETTDLTPEQKKVGLRYIGDIETNTVNEIVERFPGEITNQASLEEIGNKIAEHLGVEDINWVYSKRKSITMYGQLVGSNKLIIYPGNTSEQIKRTIVHELGHIVKPDIKQLSKQWETIKLKKHPTRLNTFTTVFRGEVYHIPAKTEQEAREYIKTWFARRKIHHPEFKKWVEENVKQLQEEIPHVEPIPREEAIGPIGERPIVERPEVIPPTEPIPEPVPDIYAITEAEKLIKIGYEFEYAGAPYKITNIRANRITTKRTDIVAEPRIWKKAELQIELAIPEKPPVKLSRKKALTLGHQLPKVLGWDDAQRRDFMQDLVGKSSMKTMTPIEYRAVVEALQTQVREAGLEYVPEELPIDKLVETLERTKKVTELPAIEELNRGEVYKLKRRIKSGLHAFVTGLERMERFFEGLDGHKRGEFTNTIWKPIQQADELSIENTNNEHVKFSDFLESQNIDTTLWLGKTEEIPGTKVKLTPFQKIGVYTLSQNKNSKRQLIRGMGFTEADITAINNSLTEQEKNVANWLMEQYEIQWPVLQQAAAQAGIDLTTLKKEFRYTPIVRTDVELDAQVDFLSGLAEPFRQDSFSPEKGMLEERKKKAYGRMEIDAAVLYMHNIGRVQRFVQMAPVAKNVGRILNNRKFKEALNTRTYGQGNKLINSWMKDAVRGTITKNTSLFAKTIAIMRRNGILYAIGYNIPSSLRQTLSLSNAVATDPRMLEHVPVNIAKASTPSGYKTMEDFVYSRSLLAKTRSYDRDLRQKWNRENLRLKLRRKAPWSRKVMRWIRWMDRHTVVVAWKSLYDVGMQKFNDEQQAMTFADKWIGRTQPMANAKDLPDFFRGGTLERLLTTFQNQINNNGNFYAYDIMGAKTTKQISWPMVGYRAMFSYVLPAIMFGMIGRAAPPRTLKQLLIDLVTYPIAPVLLIGRWIDRMIRGWGQSGTIAEIAPEEFVKLGRAVGRGDIYNIIKRAATTIGAITGRIPAQLIRTTEGAIDFYAGTTEDPRRLIYSEWALKQGEPAKEEITLSRKR